MRFAASILCVLALASLAAVAARADIGIRSMTPQAASPGERVRLTIAGYLGPRPWRPMPIVIVSIDAAPRPYPCRGGLCTPRLYPSQLRRSPYRLLGRVNTWRVRNARDTSGIATFTFSVPKLRPGRYVLGLYCATCAAGPRGSLIIAPHLILTLKGSS